jgi:hypothetical protein
MDPNGDDLTPNTVSEQAHKGDRFPQEGFGKERAMRARSLVVPFALFAVTSLLSGCSTPRQPVCAKFVESDFAAFAGAGTSAITGQAFMKTRSGEVKLGAGNTVQLIPATAYTKEIRERSTIRGEALEPPTPDLAKYVRKTVADATGGFEFRNIPAGEYFLECSITWEVATQYGLKTDGGLAHAAVKVGPGETAKIILTR